MMTAVAEIGFFNTIEKSQEHQNYPDKSHLQLVFKNNQRFLTQTVLKAPCSPKKICENEVAALLNKGQKYLFEQTCISYNEDIECTLKTIIKLDFFDRMHKGRETEYFEKWCQENQHKSLINIENHKIDEKSILTRGDIFGSIWVIEWNPQHRSTVNFSANFVGSDFDKRLGCEGAIMTLKSETFELLQGIDYQLNYSVPRSYKTCCRLKIFKFKGGDRKFKQDYLKFLKKDQELKREMHKFNLSFQKIEECQKALDELNEKERLATQEIYADNVSDINSLLVCDTDSNYNFNFSPISQNNIHLCYINQKKHQHVKNVVKNDMKIFNKDDMKKYSIIKNNIDRKQIYSEFEKTDSVLNIKNEPDYKSVEFTIRNFRRDKCDTDARTIKNIKDHIYLTSNVSKNTFVNYKNKFEESEAHGVINSIESRHIDEINKTAFENLDTSQDIKNKSSFTPTKKSIFSNFNHMNSNFNLKSDLSMLNNNDILNFDYKELPQTPINDILQQYTSDDDDLNFDCNIFQFDEFNKLIEAIKIKKSDSMSPYCEEKYFNGESRDIKNENKNRNINCVLPKTNSKILFDDNIKDIMNLDQTLFEFNAKKLSKLNQLDKYKLLCQKIMLVEENLAELEYLKSLEEYKDDEFNNIELKNEEMINSCKNQSIQMLEHDPKNISGLRLMNEKIISSSISDILTCQKKESDYFIKQKLVERQKFMADVEKSVRTNLVEEYDKEAQIKLGSKLKIIEEMKYMSEIENMYKKHLAEIEFVISEMNLNIEDCIKQKCTKTNALKRKWKTESRSKTQTQKIKTNKKINDVNAEKEKLAIESEMFEKIQKAKEEIIVAEVDSMVDQIIAEKNEEIRKRKLKEMSFRVETSKIIQQKEINVGKIIAESEKIKKIKNIETKKSIRQQKAGFDIISAELDAYKKYTELDDKNFNNNTDYKLNDNTISKDFEKEFPINTKIFDREKLIPKIIYDSNMMIDESNIVFSKQKKEIQNIDYESNQIETFINKRKKFFNNFPNQNKTKIDIDRCIGNKLFSNDLSVLNHKKFSAGKNLETSTDTFNDSLNIEKSFDNIQCSLQNHMLENIDYNNLKQTNEAPIYIKSKINKEFDNQSKNTGNIAKDTEIKESLLKYGTESKIDFVLSCENKDSQLRKSDHDYKLDNKIAKITHVNKTEEIENNILSKESNIDKSYQNILKKYESIEEIIVNKKRKCIEELYSYQLSNKTSFENSSLQKKKKLYDEEYIQNSKYTEESLSEDYLFMDSNKWPINHNVKEYKIHKNSNDNALRDICNDQSKYMTGNFTKNILPKNRFETPIMEVKKKLENANKEIESQKLTLSSYMKSFEDNFIEPSQETIFYEPQNEIDENKYIEVDSNSPPSYEQIESFKMSTTSTNNQNVTFSPCNSMPSYVESNYKKVIDMSNAQLIDWLIENKFDEASIAIKNMNGQDLLHLSETKIKNMMGYSEGSILYKLLHHNDENKLSMVECRKTFNIKLCSSDGQLIQNSEYSIQVKNVMDLMFSLAIAYNFRFEQILYVYTYDSFFSEVIVSDEILSSFKDQGSYAVILNTNKNFSNNFKVGFIPIKI